MASPKPIPTGTPKPATAPKVTNPVAKAATAAPTAAIQAEIQRKAAAGIPLTNPTAASTAAYKAAVPTSGAAVSAPKPSSPAVAVKSPTGITNQPYNPNSGMQIAAQPYNPTSGMQITNQSYPSTPAIPKSNYPLTAATTTPITNYPGTAVAANPTNYSNAAVGASPQTSPSQTAAALSPTQYVSKGGSALNEILYNKGIYNASNKNYVAATVKPLYAQLDPSTAAAVKDMNYDQLRDYINGLGNTQPSNQPTAAVQTNPTPAANTSGVAVQQSDTPYMQLSPEQINQQADYQIAAERANRKRVLDQTRDALQADFDYSNQITRDNRALEDASFYRNNAPAAWDGSQGYRGAMMDRNRSIQDTATQRDFNNQLASAQQAFADWDILSTQQRQSLINDMTRLERDYGLNVGQLTGNFNGQRTLAGQAQDYSQMADQRNFGYQQQQDQIANDAQYGGTYNGNQTVAQQQQEWNNRFNYGQAIGQFGNGQQTLEAKNQAFNQGMQTRQQNFVEGQQNWQNNFDLAKFTEDVRQYGLDYALQQQQVAIQQQNANTSYMSAANSNNNNNFNKLMDIWKATGTAPSGLEGYGVQSGTVYSAGAAKAAQNTTAEQYATNYLDKAAQYEDGELLNRDAMEASILESGLPSSEMKKLYTRYGIPLPSGE